MVAFGSEVVNRTARGHAGNQGAGVAEGNAAVHTACPLRPEFVLRHVMMKLLPVVDALVRRPIRRQFPCKLDESCGLPHISCKTSPTTPKRGGPPSPDRRG